MSNRQSVCISQIYVIWRTISFQILNVFMVRWKHLLRTLFSWNGNCQHIKFVRGDVFIIYNGFNENTFIIQSSAVITRFNIVRYYINEYRNWSRIWIRRWIHKDTPYLALTGEIWGVFCGYLWENWPRYNGTALYLKYKHGCPTSSWQWIKWSYFVPNQFGLARGNFLSWEQQSNFLFINWQGPVSI